MNLEDEMAQGDIVVEEIYCQYLKGFQRFVADCASNVDNLLGECLPSERRGGD